ncbi:MAG: hypothetical protein UZ22_OP11002000842 [Microgenomates bacterium OLB23]|nr:MAG: hypothetical protein UZ22_OP11002000842 [Microgenomates bacterium OLB23]
MLDQEPEGVIQIENILPENDDITGTVEIITESSSSFTTPLLARDAQYTMYLTGYNTQTREVVVGNFTDAIVLNLADGYSLDCVANPFAVELTFINVNGGIVARRLVDNDCDIITGEASELDINIGDAIDTSTFSDDPHVMIVRTVSTDADFEGLKLTFTRQSGQDWPAQGRSVVSEATTGGNVTKKLNCFSHIHSSPLSFLSPPFKIVAIRDRTLHHLGIISSC